MEKSESIKEIAGALRKFKMAVQAVPKDATNPFFKSKYASLDNVLGTIEEPMFANGLSFAQFPSYIRTFGLDVEAAQPALTTIIMHTSGEWISAVTPLELKGHTPQDQGSAITYMRRYALSAALGLATEDDDDGNAASKPAAAMPAAPKKVEAERDLKKKRIKELCDETALVPLLSKSDYEQYVLGATGLVLEPENFDEIIGRLEAFNTKK